MLHAEVPLVQTILGAVLKIFLVKRAAATWISRLMSVHSNCRVLERIVALINPGEYIFSNEMVLELEEKDLQI
jgi:hypothetical protein